MARKETKTLEPGTYDLVEDTGECKHEFIVGPQRTIQNKKTNMHVGHCDACGLEVALELDEADNRTGKSWQIIYGASKPAVDEDGHDLEWHQSECPRCIEAGGGVWDWCQKALPLAAKKPL
jgi:hypothetical protein